MFNRTTDNAVALPPLPPSATDGDANEAYGSIQAISEAVKTASAWVPLLKREMAQAIIGQDHLVERLLVGLLAGGHILLEGLPGLAKTLAVKTLAAAVSTDFRRIQFTPDMLPADIIGTEIYNPRATTFEVKRGPIFSSLILADEINRAPSKVQSALLEAMQEKQVTIGETSFSLPQLFLVLATQNPIEQEGTYPLPEAQIDRFMLKVVVDYPTQEQERQIIDAVDHTDSRIKVNPVVSPDDILAARSVVDTIYLDNRIKDYIVSLVCATRDPRAFKLDLHEYIETGASPRATINLKVVARTLAFLNGRGYVIPDDIKACAMDVMRHRIRISYEAEAEDVSSEDIIRKILDTVPVP
ncbi:ATPase family associated with various cellular activities [bacterium BMS3Bbin14]|nr:ATPase family associated with various cellular activities [bacterium BMS3Abin13]GBE51871.1 ATPase family associated with various cellular activities [bacterium BMS3Bbin14]